MADDGSVRAFRSTAPALGYSGPLDGFRGYAMIAVMFAHASHAMFASFAASVDVFFVVSGFLITTLLLEEVRKEGSVSLRRFYSRRALRLLPLLYLTLGLTLLFALIIGGEKLIHDTVSDVLAGGTYVYHIVHPVGGEVVAGGPPEVRPLVQLWSLSVEEHFYLFGVLVILFTVRRGWVKALMVGAAVMIVAGAVSRGVGFLGPFRFWWQRPDSLMIGVLLALGNAHVAELSETARRRISKGAAPAFAVLVVVVGVGTGFARGPLRVPWEPPPGGHLSDDLYWGRFGFTICAIATAWLVIASVRSSPRWLTSLLTWKPATFVGVRSYAFYLIHVPLAVLLGEAFDDAPAVAAVLYLPMLFGLVELSHRWVEKPAARWRRRLTTPDRAAVGDQRIGG